MNKRGIKALFGAGLCLFSLPGLAGERITASYSFLWKGLLVSSVEAKADMKPDAYDLAINFRMRGLAKLFANGRSEVTSSGLLTDDGTVQPLHYRSEGRWDGEDYSRTMTFGDEGVLQTLEQDWPEKWLEKYPREEVPEELRRGPDPASLAMMILKARVPEPGAEGPMVTRVQAFDGDSVFEYLVSCGTEQVELEPSRHSDHAGRAYECTLDGNLVAGRRILTEKEKEKLEKKRAKEERKREKGKLEEEEPPKFWLAPQADAAYLLPVRAEMSTDMGRVHMYLKELEITPLPAETTMNSR